VISNPSPTMMELGSYWAHYSMWFLKAKTSGKSFCIEPQVPLLEIGKNNFKINNFEGTHLNSSIGINQDNLENIFLRHHLDKIDILHSDIQGAEVEMLHGAKSLLRERKIEYFFISTHSENLHNQVIHMLQEFEYRIEISSPFDLHTTSYDGLIVASSPDAKTIFESFVPLGRIEILNSKSSEIVSYLHSVNSEQESESFSD